MKTRDFAGSSHLKPKGFFEIPSDRKLRIQKMKLDILQDLISNRDYHCGNLLVSDRFGWIIGVDHGASRFKDGEAFHTGLIPIKYPDLSVDEVQELMRYLGRVREIASRAEERIGPRATPSFTQTIEKADRELTSILSQVSK